MDEDDIEITVVPPGGPATTYTTVIPPDCRCLWDRHGVGVEDATLLPEDAIATWYVLTSRDPQCPHHGDREG